MNVARVIRAIVRAWGVRDHRLASVAIEPCCGYGEIRKLRARLMVQNLGSGPRSEIEVREEPTLDAALLSLAEQVCDNLYQDGEMVAADDLRAVLEQEV